jgi:hypothetical protein
MLLTKEVYRDDSSQRIRKIFYNDKQQITGTLELSKADGEEYGYLDVHEYTGESYRQIRYKDNTKAYKHFISQGHGVLGKPGWHSIADAHSVQDFKYENGALISESYKNEYGATYSHHYTYQNGMKVSETTVNTEGVVTKINYVYQGKKMLSKSTVINDQFSDQINYRYHENDLLAEEQRFLKHKESLYLSTQKNFFYNAKKELEKTEHHGRYDGTMHLYKVEETILKGNERNIKMSMIPDVDVVIGQYDLASMYEFMKRENMEWIIPVFNKEYITKTKLKLFSHNIEKIDEQGGVVAVRIMNPEDNTELGRAVFRNEYNEMSLLEFVISYRVLDNGREEENNITKYYYKD